MMLSAEEQQTLRTILDRVYQSVIADPARRAAERRQHRRAADQRRAR
jgi:hypothetical protein